MILVDANIFMYAAGADHPNKAASVAFLTAVASGQIDACVDAEVLQEILHRYRALRRWSEGGQVYDLARRIVPMVMPIEAETVDRARNLLDQFDSLTARDALHAAAALKVGGEICSYDTDYDCIPGLLRRLPDQL